MGQSERALTLRVQRYGAVLELVERGVVVFVDGDELLFKSLELVFVLWLGLHGQGELLLEFV